MPSHFKVKEYCPMVFRNIRERFGIDDLDYKESLTRYDKTLIVEKNQLFHISFRIALDHSHCPTIHQEKAVRNSI